MAGKPLFDQVAEGEMGERHGPTAADVLQAERETILNEGDFREYQVSGALN